MEIETIPNVINHKSKCLEQDTASRNPVTYRRIAGLSPHHGEGLAITRWLLLLNELDSVRDCFLPSKFVFSLPRWLILARKGMTAIPRFFEIRKFERGATGQNRLNVVHSQPGRFSNTQSLQLR